MYLTLVLWTCLTVQSKIILDWWTEVSLSFSQGCKHSWQPKLYIGQSVSKSETDSQWISQIDKESVGKSDRHVSSPEGSRGKGLRERQQPGDKALTWGGCRVIPPFNTARPWFSAQPWSAQPLPRLNCHNPTLPRLRAATHTQAQRKGA